MAWEEYSKLLSGAGIAQKDIEFLRKAFEFASEIHKDEKRESGEPYITHPIEVSSKLLKLKMDIPTIAAGLLHDTIECSNEASKFVKKNFGEEISFLVEAVTKVDKIRARGAERALESVRKMFLAVAQDVRVVIIKLMDRMHNMETLSYIKPEKQERISKETLTLYAPLAERLGMWNIKADLEDLSMKYLYPQEYKNIKIEVKKRIPERERFLAKIAATIKEELGKENVIPEEISYRSKHLYSVWQKLDKYEGDWSQIFDLIAIRIIVSDIKSCYAALGIIHKLWKPVPGKFKDYIALPKPNGYQSLHTSVFSDKGRVVEFQLRTRVMHEEAESGIAAHWAYSELGKPKSGFRAIGKKFNWIHQLHDWQKEFEKSHSSSDELLESLKIDFFKDRIFVLTPKGDVIDLPEGSTALDFAYHIHSDIGNHTSGAKANGRLIPFSRELRSGEVVEITTQKNKKPSSEWLHLAKTGLAKSRIRKALRISKGSSLLSPFENPVELKIYGKNRVGLIRDITGIFSRMRINIQSMDANRQGNEEAPIRIIFFPKNKEETTRVENSLKKIRDVSKVSHKTK